MLNSHSEKDSPDVDNLVQKIFSGTKETGLQEWIEYAEDLEKYFPTRNMEETVHSLVEEYDEYTFYEELPYKLADRDFKQKYKTFEINKMSPETQFLHKEELAEKYWKEFEKNGLKNLKIR